MRTTSSDGTEISYESFGSGRPVLLLHGFSNDQSMWVRSGWVEQLRGNFTVVTLDLRGCGLSEKPERASAYSIDAHLEDIDAVLRECGTRRPVVWGWSLGATVALHLAKRGAAAATISAGTYFGPIFTTAYVASRLAETSHPVTQARWSGLATWPAVSPADVQGPMLAYTGTRDTAVVEKLLHQRSAIEATGSSLHVLPDLNHIELVTAVPQVADVVLPFIHAAA